MNRSLVGTAFNVNRSPLLRSSHYFAPLINEFFERDLFPLVSELSRSAPESNMKNSYVAPPVDINESAEEYIFTTDLPGLKKEDISIECDNQQLTFTAERKNENSDYKQDLQERFYGTYQRRFLLPMGVDSDNIQAAYESGVLTICVPKIEVSKARRIVLE